MAYDPDYPPKNRNQSDLGPIDIQIQHADGVLKLTPNTVIEMFLSSAGLAQAAGLKPVEGAASDLSGAPAVIYRTDDWELPLTVDEIAALVGSELTPNEFVILRDRYGIGFELHDDFYDSSSGEAWEPKGLRQRYLTHLAAVGAGLEATDATGIYLTPKG